MARTYLFYDTETTGLNVAFSQVLRFAAIRTDEDLRELERHQISIRLHPDVIPEPEALLATGLRISDLRDGAPEFEAMGRIHALFNTPGTVTAGYNSLGFDDDLLRFSFYRNFLPPYAHQRLGRIDLLPMTVMVRLFRRHWLAWPEADGKPNLKLENLNRENNLAAGRAHDAMVDVEATLELARRYRKEEAEWRWLTGLFDREQDRRRQAQLPEICGGEPGLYRLAVLAHSRIGAEDGYIAPVVCLGQSIPYPNQTLWLRLDRDDLRDTVPDNIPQTTWAYRKKDGDDLLLLSPRPKYVRILREERLARMNENRRLLESRPSLLAAIADYYRHFRYPVVPNVDADADLYSSFLSPAEEAACFRFRSTPPVGRCALLSQMPTPRLAALAVRALGRNYPELLTGAAAEEFAAHMRSVHPSDAALTLVDYKGNPRHTPHACLNRIAALTAERMLSTEEIEILAGLKSYLGETFGLAVVSEIETPQESQH